MITFSTWLTISRIALAPCIMLAIYKKIWICAIIFFMAASATDFLDGYYARLYDQESLLGALLDPFADKFLFFCTITALYTVPGQLLLPGWFVALLVTKHIIILSAAFFLLMRKRSIIIPPSLLSKLVTGLLMVFMLYLMFIHCGIMHDQYVAFSIRFFSIALVVIFLDYTFKAYRLLQYRG